MAQQVVGTNEKDRQSVQKTTHKTVEIKSNTKGVSEVPVMTTPDRVEIGVAKSTKMDLPNHKGMGTH